MTSTSSTASIGFPATTLPGMGNSNRLVSTQFWLDRPDLYHVYLLQIVVDIS